MRRQLARSFAIASTIATVAVATSRAQTKIVFPPQLANVEGESSTALPFGLGTPARMQLVYRVPPPRAGAMIKEFAFRADGRKGSSYPAKRFVQCFAGIGLSANGYTRMSKKFLDNRYGIQTPAFNGKLELPVQPLQATTRNRPFDLRFKCSKPVLHRGFDHGQLLIEIGIVNQPKGNWELDSPFVCTSVGQDVGKIGPRCRFSDTSLKAPRQPILTNAPTVELGGSATFTVSGLPSVAPTLFVFGVRDSGPWGGGTLPFHLVDKKTIPFPAPDCYANNDWITLRFAQGKNGKATASMPIPLHEFWRDVWFYCQTLTLDLGANQMGVVWSRSRKVKPCGPVQCARVFSLGSYQVDSGIVQTGSAPVLELTY